MGRLAVVVMLLGSISAFGQRLQFVDDFKKVGRDSYVLTFDSEEDAIRKHSYVLDMNGIDTNYTAYTRGDNPVVFSYYKLSKNKVMATFIIRQIDKYDVCFIETDDKDTYFVDVIDNSGAPVQLIYLKP